MAGIGFALERMASGGTLASVSGAYVGATFVVSGPLILTALTIAGVSASAGMSSVAVQDFRTILIYDFLLSNVLAAPLALSLTRLFADELYARRTEYLQSAWIMALGLFAVVGLVVVAPASASLLDGPRAAAASRTFLLLGALWLTIPLVAVLRHHVSISVAFLAGLAVAVAQARLLDLHNAAMLLDAFCMGLVVTLAVLVVRIVTELGAGARLEWRIVRAYSRYLELPAIGLCMALGAWVDKLIMWANVPDAVVTLSSGGLPTMPDYDSALFWAQLSSIPVMAIFFVNVEPRFYRLYRRFYRSFGRKATQREVRDRQSALGDFATRSVLGLLGAGIMIAATAVLLSYGAVVHLDLPASLAGVLRAAMFGGAVQTAVLICLCFLLYFDLRRHALAVALVGVLTNAGFTTALLPLGAAWHGYGYMMAAMTTFVFAFATLSRQTRWLTYHAFITTNDSAKPSARAERRIGIDPI